MCVIALALDASPDWAVLVAANRDEFHARPTEALHWWPDAPQVCAGRDRSAGGTWMGATRAGRFAAVTNLRGAAVAPAGTRRSRGALVADFLCAPVASGAPALAGHDDAEVYAWHASRERQAFDGFNLVVGGLRPGAPWHWAGSSDAAPRRLDAGVHALSNGAFGHDWHKTRVLAGALADAAATTDPDTLARTLLRALADTRCPPDAALPDTGIGLVRERELAPVFVRAPGYGTRTSTVLCAARDGTVRIVERTFSEHPDAAPATRTVEFALA